MPFIYDMGPWRRIASRPKPYSNPGLLEENRLEAACWENAEVSGVILNLNPTQPLTLLGGSAFLLRGIPRPRQKPLQLGVENPAYGQGYQGVLLSINF